MSHAYTPGLTITPHTVVRRERRLPVAGEVLVAAGTAVEASTVVARCELPGPVRTVNLAARLGLEPARAHEALVVPVGTRVGEGERIAESRGMFGLLRTGLVSPCDGTLESLSAVTGQLMVRGPAVPIEVLAHLQGRVVDVIPGQGVRLETRAALVQGIFGIGGEVHGPLVCAVDSPESELVETRIGPHLRGRVVVGGAHASAAALRRARDVGARAVVIGGLDDLDLRELLGYDLGVAVTGGETIGLTVVLTEGFGRLAMSERAWTLLRAHEGRVASVNGATQIRAGVQRPEVVIPLEEGQELAPLPLRAVLEPGARVRVIREPWFGRLGRITELPSELCALETEARVRVVEVEFEDGARHRVPRANVERVGA
jgi:hypothetical protein